MKRLARTTGILLFAALLFSTGVAGADTPPPTSVTLVGSLQDELGSPGDWIPGMEVTHLTYDGDDDVWQGSFTIPAGSYEYKVALNDSWDENYGMHAARNGANIPLNLSAQTTVKFYYDHKTHWITDNHNSVIAVAPGNFQSELGASGDWQPDSLRSWLQDPDGDGVFTFSTGLLPQGNYECKVALNESWDTNYGAGGVQNGPNINFSVLTSCAILTFSYNATSHVLTIDNTPPFPQPTSVTVVGSFQDEVGSPGDWMPSDYVTHLTYDATDGVWQGTFNIPAGPYEYKVAINDSWDENYGANAMPNGANIPLNLSAATTVKFYYDHKTHWITDNRNSVIAVVPGNFQSELGAPGDWQPDCLRSWLQDPDGDGTFGFVAQGLPMGNYECKVALNESWDTNYGQDGVQNGPNIYFTVPSDCMDMIFSYNSTSHVLTVTPAEIVNAAPTAVAGDDQSIRAGATVYLDGTASYDDNTPSASLGYAWAFVSVPSGSGATLTGADTATPSFVADVAGTYTVALMVTDAAGLASAADEVVISTNNLAPTAVAMASPTLVVVGNTVNLDGSGSSDPENDALGFAWTLTNAPAGNTASIVGADTATPTFTPVVPGTYEIALEVSDPIGPGSSDSVEITAVTASDFAVTEVLDARNDVASLPPAQVSTQGNRTALDNFLRQAAAAIQAGDTATAVDKLKKAIERTDGCVLRGAPDGSGSGRDWITDCAAQAEIYASLTAALDALAP